MSRPQLLNKLTSKLASMPQTEADVIYMLSRIRKLLEIDEYPEKYKLLKFYCDLALHATISRPPKVVAEKLARMTDEPAYQGTIIGFEELHAQLRTFLEEYDLPNFYERSTSEDRNALYSTLLGIYEETPIVVTYVGRKYRIMIQKQSPLECLISIDQLNPPS